MQGNNPKILIKEFQHLISGHTDLQITLFSYAASNHKKIHIVKINNKVTFNSQNKLISILNIKFPGLKLKDFENSSNSLYLKLIKKEVTMLLT